MTQTIPSKAKAAKQSALVQRLTRQFYPDPGAQARWFREEILRRIDGGSVILDYGAGRGRSGVVNFRSIAGSVHGVDVDAAVFENPLLDEARLLESTAIPYGDATFDVVYALWVLEHLEDPIVLFKEVRRVLKPGGVFVARTPNLYHYVPLVARLTPHALHERVVQKTEGRPAKDTFPTFYRANSERQVRRLAQEAGLGVEKVLLEEDLPRRLRSNALTYLLGIAYERAVNGLEVLRHFRGNLTVVLKKPER